MYRQTSRTRCRLTTLAAGVLVNLLVYYTAAPALAANHIPSTASSGSPASLGSAAVVAGDYVYVSGQYGDLDGSYGDIRVQTEVVLDKISAILAEAGTGMDQVVSAYVYLRNKPDFQAMNEVYSSYSGWPTTTHVTAEGEDLDLAVRTTMSGDLVGPPDALVQITMIALRSGAERLIIQPPGWGKSNLPYPWGIKSGDTLWVSGLVPSEKIPERRAGYERSGDIKVNVSLVYSQVDTVLTTAGFEKADNVFSRLYIQDQSLAPAAEAATTAYYGEDAPAISVQRGGIMGFNTHNENTNIAIKGPKIHINVDGGARVGSDAVVAGGRFFSGGIQGRPELDTKTQARDAFATIGDALELADYDWSEVTDVWILLADTRDYDDVASIYNEVFKSNPPATSVIGFQPTGRGSVQIQVIAVKN